MQIKQMSHKLAHLLDTASKFAFASFPVSGLKDEKWI